MKRAKNICRPVIAFLLLLVFFTIQSGKVLHSHVSTAATHIAFDGDTVDQTGDCAICDYQLSKDATPELLSFNMQKLPFTVASVAVWQQHLTTSIGLHFSDRGPPAFA